MRKIAKRTTIYKLIKIGFFSCLLITSFYIGLNFTKENVNSGIVHDLPKSATTDRGFIFISSDLDFNAANGVISGNGTEMAPYVIANWRIIGPFTQPCIEIRDTSAFFIVQDCIISNGENIGAIRLATLQNGVLMNNTIYDSEYGIVCDQVNNADISNNHCYDGSDLGIFIINSEDILISNNIAHGNQRWGIILQNTNSSSVIGNFAYQNLWDGIRLEPGFSNLIENNTVFNNNGNGIIAYSSEDNIFTENNCSYNTKHGISFLFESKNNQVFNNYLYGNGYGCIEDINELNNCYDNICLESDLHAFFLTSKSTISVGEIVEFTDTSTSNLPIIGHNWDFGDGNVSTDPNPSHSYEETGIKIVTLKVEDSSGALSSNSRTLSVVDDESNTNKDDPFAYVFEYIDGYPFVSFWIILVFPLVVLIRKTNNKRKKND